MQPAKEEKSWVLRAAVIIIPIILVVMGIWIWPLLQQAYSLPDTAVLTYQQALSQMIPPGTGRITRTRVIEEALAGTLGQLSDVAAENPAPRFKELLRILRFNAKMGHRAAAVMAAPTATRIAQFNGGIKTGQFQISGSAATIPGGGIAASGPALSMGNGNSKRDKADIRASMRAVTHIIQKFINNRASVQQVKDILTAQMRTLLRVTTVLPWQRQLSHIMTFNAAMSRWIYIVSQLPPDQRQAMLNWARFRAQDVELMRLVMAGRVSKRLRTVPIAPKLHGVERAWLVHRLLADPCVSVELAMLHELWNIPASPRLAEVLWNWAIIEPLPNGHKVHAVRGKKLNGRTSAIKRTNAVQRYQQARRFGGQVLLRWDTPFIDPMIVQVCRLRADHHAGFGFTEARAVNNSVLRIRIFRELFAQRKPVGAIPYLLRIVHEPVLRHALAGNYYVDNRTAALWMLLVAAGENPLKFGFIKGHWPAIASSQVEMRDIAHITTWWQSHGMKFG